MMGHRILGNSLLLMGEFAESRAHLDRALAPYHPAEHRSLMTRFGQDHGVTVLSFRSWAVWCLGYPKAALADADRAVEDARKIGQAAALMAALACAAVPHMLCGNYAAASSLLDELAALADEKSTAYWKATRAVQQGEVFARTGNALAAVQMISSGLTAQRSIGTTTFVPGFLSSLARAYVDLGRFDDAWRCIDEAVAQKETTHEKWREAEIWLRAGEIALLSPERDAAKAETHFERALAVARQQQAKSWELRASMSLARLWHDQGKVQQARELLAPVYGWFTEGFDTSDLKEAKALLEELTI
jgi:predicted ATPase